MLKYKDFQLIQPTPESEVQIIDLIERKNGSVFHEVELNRIVSETFQTQLYYLVDDPSKINCFSPVHMVKNEKGLKRYHFKPLFDIPYGGFVGDEKINIDEFKLGFFDSLKYEGFPYNEDNKWSMEEKTVGETSMVDLSLSEDEIFSSIIHSKKRNKIRKAGKEGVTVKQYKNIEGFELFWKILKPLHDKLGFNDKMDVNYYKSIFCHYAKNEQAFLLIAFKDDIPLSGVFILGNKNYMHYYKGASVFGMRNEGQGELLQWEAIKASKSLGVQYYDLCALNKEKLPAIYSFKTGISDKIVTYPIYSENKRGFQIANRILKLL